MFHPQPKQQFRTYPLRATQLSKLNIEMSQLNQQIYQNRNQIQQIRKKFQNQQYQNAYIQRLMQKNKILQLKKEQFEYINKMHHYHQSNEDQEKKISLKMHNNLANEYKQQIEENKRRKSQEKDLQRQKDRQLMEKNQQQVYRIEVEKHQQSSRREYENYLNSKKMQQDSSSSGKKQRQLQKRQYSEAINYIQPSQKQLAYDNFYTSNKQRQDSLTKIYKTSTQPLNQNRRNQLNSIQRKNELQYKQSLQRKALQESQRITNNNEQLKEYLQRQMQYNTAKKQQQTQHKLSEDTQRQQHQINNQKYQHQTRHKAKLQQSLYSDQLSKQYFQQMEIQKQNSHRGKQHSYLNQSTDAIYTKDAYSPESLSSGLFLGHQKGRVSMHNPLTNPISFTVGMTNPYVLKQYEDKRLSSANKESNLAKLAHHSFIN